MSKIDVVTNQQHMIKLYEMSKNNIMTFDFGFSFDKETIITKINNQITVITKFLEKVQKLTNEELDKFVQIPANMELDKEIKAIHSQIELNI